MKEGTGGVGGSGDSALLRMFFILGRYHPNQCVAIERVNVYLGMWLPTPNDPSCPLLSADFTGKSDTIILIRSLHSCYLTWLVLLIACFTYQFLDILSHCPWCHPESYPWQTAIKLTLVLFENVKFIWHHSLNLPHQNHQHHHAFLCLWGSGGKSFFFKCTSTSSGTLFKQNFSPQFSLSICHLLGLQTCLETTSILETTQKTNPVWGP